MRKRLESYINRFFKNQFFEKGRGPKIPVLFLWSLVKIVSVVLMKTEWRIWKSKRQTEVERRCRNVLNIGYLISFVIIQSTKQLVILQFYFLRVLSDGADFCCVDYYNDGKSCKGIKKSGSHIYV